jgi:hypothetical protein
MREGFDNKSRYDNAHYTGAMIFAGGGHALSVSPAPVSFKTSRAGTSRRGAIRKLSEKKKNDDQQNGGEARPVLTNRQGHPVYDNQNNRTVGDRGPTTVEN